MVSIVFQDGSVRDYGAFHGNYTQLYLSVDFNTSYDFRNFYSVGRSQVRCPQGLERVWKANNTAA